MSQAMNQTASDPWQQQQSDPWNQAPSQGMQLGKPIAQITKDKTSTKSTSISDDWQVLVSKARSKKDMRSVKNNQGTTQNFLDQMSKFPCYCPNPPGINCVQHGSNPTINQVEGKWQKVSATLDSAAIETVGPPNIGTCFPLIPTVASKNGINYSAANGSPIKNYGQRILQGLDNSWKVKTMPMQVAQVKKVLASASQICMAGNRCMLDIENGSWIEDKSTGEITEVDYVDGEFTFDMWIPAATGPSINAVPAESCISDPIALFEGNSEGSPKSAIRPGFTRPE